MCIRGLAAVECLRQVPDLEPTTPLKYMFAGGVAMLMYDLGTGIADGVQREHRKFTNNLRLIKSYHGYFLK